MIIGVDASRAFLPQRTGTENYSYHLIKTLLEVDKKNQYRLYVRQPIRNLAGARVIGWPKLWTQGGLALECLLRPPEILFIPAHTLPVIRRPSLKTVVTIHGLEYEYLPEHYQFPQRLYLNKSTEYAVAQASHLIAVSQWTKKQLVRLLGADPKKISVVYEGVAEPAVISRTAPPAQPYLLFVGTVQPRKNLVKLIKAFAKIHRSVDASIRLVIAGKLGWLYDEVLEAPKKFGVTQKVEFLGYVSDKQLTRLYQGALCFILPSLCEGFGLPALEAMRLGCPVIVSRTGALPEVVGQAGLLVDPRRTKEIFGAMKLMIENQELREDLREKGFRQVRGFSWPKAARETAKIFEKVAQIGES